MSLKVAGVGAGYFSHYHYDAWQRIGCVDVVAICDRDLMRAHSTAKRHGIPLVFDQFSAMLEDTEPDKRDIITPPESHEGSRASSSRRCILRQRESAKPSWRR